MAHTPWLNAVYYFGCWRRSGHYLHLPGMQSAYGLIAHDRMQGLDGSLAPKDGEAGLDWEPQFKAKFWRLTGYTPGPYSALSWWDRSVDKRGACNSIMFIPGDTVDAATALALAEKQFPEVMSRLPKIELLPGVFEKTHANPKEA